LAKLLEKARPDTTLFDLRHDMVLKHTPVKTYTYNQKKIDDYLCCRFIHRIKVKETQEKDAKYFSLGRVGLEIQKEEQRFMGVK